MCKHFHPWCGIDGKLCIGCAQEPRGKAIEPKNDRGEATELALWESNVAYILERCPFAVRSREGGGAENLLQSLVLTFAKMQKNLEESEQGRQELAGLARSLKRDLVSLQRAYPANQCDGCRAGHPIDADGLHEMNPGDFMVCQKAKYG